MLGVLAHPGHGAAAGDTRAVLLLVAAGVLLSVSLFVLARRGLKPVTFGPLGLGTAALVFGLAVRGDDDQITRIDVDPTEVEVSILEPADDATVPAGEPVTVTVEVDGGELATDVDDEAGHLHVTVNGDLVQMPFGNQAEVTFLPGQHTLTVEYVDNLHLPFEPTVERSVELTAVEGAAADGEGAEGEGGDGGAAPED